MAEFFPDIKKIEYEGPDSKNPLSFKHYNATAEVEGKTMQGITKIPRKAVQQGHTIHTITPENTLSRSSIKVLWGDKDFIYTQDDMTPGHQLITHPVPTPVPGMKLRRTNPATDDTIVATENRP